MVDRSGKRCFIVSLAFPNFQILLHIYLFTHLQSLQEKYIQVKNFTGNKNFKYGDNHWMLVEMNDRIVRNWLDSNNLVVICCF